MKLRHIFFSLVLTFHFALNQAAAQTSIASRIDTIVEAPIKAGKVAGASVFVVKAGETIVQKGYGFADLELDVPTPAHATYEIGSVTKQFTAASILLLKEHGKLSLDDELTRFLPDYPAQGNHVSVRHLLNHTSGIKGYTELPEFGEFMMQKKPKEELLKLFSSKPFDFKPGEEEIYNNSAFFLLGLIIEKVSGTSYASFVQENLFDKVGMKDSYYCSERAIHKNHAHGYDTVRNELVLKGYLDHTWPYAAGSLCSSASDLVLWNKALHGGKVLSADSYREMTSPGLLNDGTRIRYGMGIGLSATDGRRTIGHGGSINGFLAESEYYPDDDLIIVVLLNTAGPVGPRELARQIAESVLGKAPDRSRPLQDDPAQFTGLYTGRGRGRQTSIRIAFSAGQLTFANSGAPASAAKTLKYYGNDSFAVDDTIVTFERLGGKVSKLRLDTGGGYNVLVRESERQ